MAYSQRSKINLVNGLINNTPIGTTTPSTGSFTTITTTGNANIGGNLHVDGTTTTLNTQTILIKDQHLYLNNGYTTVSARTGGIVANRLPTSNVLNTTGAGVFTIGVASVSNPTISLSGATANVLTTGMFVQITGATNASNNGLFEVASNNTSSLLTLRGIGTIATVEDFTQNQLTAETNPSVEIRQINVSVIRCNASTGRWEGSAGSSSGLTFLSFINGPASSTTNAIATWNGTSGNLLQNTSVLLSTTGNMTNLNSETFVSNSSNPGGTNTIWHNSSNNHIYHGTNDIENLFEFKFQQGTTLPNSLEPNAIAVSADNYYYAFGSSANASNTGVVYIYKKAGYNLILIQTINGSSTGNLFGTSVAFDYSGTRLFIGAIGTTSNAGSLSVYLRTNDTFALEQNITATGGDSTENFGYSVASNYNGDIIVVGAPNITTPANNSRALIFTRSGVTWTQGMALVGTGIGTGAGLYVGYKVSMTYDAQRIIVSHLRESTFTGSVSIFKRTTFTSSTWNEEQKILASDAAINTQFGSDIKISDNGYYIIVGSILASNGSGISTGKVYVFKRSNVTWTQTQIIIAPTADLSLSNTLGTNISLSYDGQTLVIYNPPSRVYTYYLGGNDLYYIVQNFSLSNVGSLGTIGFSKDGQHLAISKTTGIDYYYTVSKAYTSSPEITSNALVFFNSNDGKTLSDSNMTVDASFNLTLPLSLRVDTITENTLANGTTINSVSLKNGAINLLTTASNPGTSTTLWQRTSDSHIFRGAIDLEGDPNYNVVDVTTTPFSITAGNTLYTITTSTGAKVLNLPAITATPIIIRIADKGNAGTNNITINANGSNLIRGGASIVLNTNYQTVRLSSDFSGVGSWYEI